MKFQRVLSAGIGPKQYTDELVKWKRVDCVILNADGSVRFEQKGVEVPERWSQHAANVLAQKYFRKAGVPSLIKRVLEKGVPESFSRCVPEDGATFGGEYTARAVFHRLAGCWTYHGWKNGYFSSEADARVFYDEVYLSQALQLAAPNSPQFFNSGIHWAYGIEGPASGQWAVAYPGQDVRDKEGTWHGAGTDPVFYQTTNSYEHPQPHACFIQPVDDDLVNEGGIMDLWVREARLFKHGSGSGSNMSNLRAKGEKLSGGGVASGVMSWLNIGDRAAGAIQSGGTTRRAALMRILNLDHPEIEDFVEWKVREEAKAAAMYVGSQIVKNYELAGGDVVDPTVIIPDAVKDRIWGGFRAEIFGVGWEEEAINTVSGQNSNNSVRVTNEFLRKVDAKEPWDLTARTTGEVVETVRSEKLWDKICRAAWACGDPGVQFDDTIQEWATCPVDGKINASNPCFSGDTLVWTAFGPKRFDELAGSGAPIPVLTELNDGSLAYRDMQNPRKTQEETEILTVTLKTCRKGKYQNTSTVQCTPTHVFYLKDGSIKMAKDLKPNDRIESAYRKGANQTLIAIQSTSGDYILEHHLAAEYSHGRRPSWPEEHTHHKDTNRANNFPTNVEIRSQFDHLSYHNKGKKLSDKQRQTLSTFASTRTGEKNSFYGKQHSAETREKIASAVEKRNQLRDPLTGQYSSNHKVIKIEYNKERSAVYCGTVPETGRFFISLGDQHKEGILVSNCSEYLFCDNTACNLASLNLAAFLRENGSINLELYCHTVRLFTIVLDISVQMASFPSKEIAIGTYNFRTLGLGPANVGGLLMRSGLPYDSDEGRALAAGMMALMTGVAYKTSAELAGELGAFPRWEANADSMWKVLWNHGKSLTHDTLDGISQDAYRAVLGIASVHQPVVTAAGVVWNDILASMTIAVNHAGFRNAQVTVCAPTGTISYVMDCDCTGVEPEFALVKYKHLAGGGQMKIVNPAVEAALLRLGYADNEVKFVLQVIDQCGAVPIWDDGSKGPVREEHQAVFDCSNPARPGGRFLRPMSHVLMVAALQPFVSGGISKTINLPNDSTVADVDLTYREAHRLGVKSVALFRDGCKMSQPLNVAAPEEKDFETELKVLRNPKDPVNKSHIKTVVERIKEMNHDPNNLHQWDHKSNEEIIEDIRQELLNMASVENIPRGEREYLPWRRTHASNFTQKVRIGEHSLLFTVNHYDDGRPGEMLLELAGEGSTLRAMGNMAAIGWSIALQYGAPVEELVNRLAHLKFEPAGITEGHDRIKIVSSIADYIGRELGITYLGREDLADKPRPNGHDPEPTPYTESLYGSGGGSNIGGVETIPFTVPPAVVHVHSSLTGDGCPSCGHLLVRDGTCRKCTNCPYNEGCGG